MSRRLLDLAVKQRPDLQSLDLTRQSQEKFSRAQRDQMLPTLSALGTVGGTPVRPGQYYVSSWDGSIAANLNIPIFNGFLYSAQAKEAQLRAQATEQQTRQLKDRIVRDVQTAWLDANNAFTRLGVTAQLLDQANQSLALAQTRYKLGLSSIVELSQAQLQQTEAEITNTNAQYQYRLTLSAPVSRPECSHEHCSHDRGVTSMISFGVTQAAPESQFPAPRTQRDWQSPRQSPIHSQRAHSPAAASSRAHTR